MPRARAARARPVHGHNMAGPTTSPSDTTTPETPPPVPEPPALLSGPGKQREPTVDFLAPHILPSPRLRLLRLPKLYIDIILGIMAGYSIIDRDPV